MSFSGPGSQALLGAGATEGIAAAIHLEQGDHHAAEAVGMELLPLLAPLRVVDEGVVGHALNRLAARAGSGPAANPIRRALSPTNR